FGKRLESGPHELLLANFIRAGLHPLPCRLSFLVVVGADTLHTEAIGHNMRHIIGGRIPGPCSRRPRARNRAVDCTLGQTQRSCCRPLPAMQVHGIDDFRLPLGCPLFDSLVDYLHRRSHTSLWLTIWRLMPCGVACSSSCESHQIGSAMPQKLPLTPAHPALSATIERIAIQRIDFVTSFTRSLLCFLIGFQLIDAGFLLARRFPALPDRKKSRKGGCDGGDVGP